MLNSILENFKKIKLNKAHQLFGTAAPSPALVINFLTLKGGVGKTTLAFELSKHLAEKKYRVLAIDLDPQANLTLALTEMDFDEIENQTCFFEMMFENKSFSSTVLKTQHENIDLLPSTSVNSLINQSKDPQLLPRAKRLMSQLKKSYDYIIFDCNPTASVSHAMASLNSNIVISPILLDAFSIQGLSKTMIDIKDICDQFEHKLKHGVIFNKIKNTPNDLEKIEHITELLPEGTWLSRCSFWDFESEDKSQLTEIINSEINQVFEFAHQEKQALARTKLRE